MDYVRSCYSTKMWSFDPTTGLPVQFTARWYEAPASAKPIGIHHQYASANWTKGTLYQEQVGEVLTASRPWNNGAPADGVVGSNQCGSADQWMGRLDRLTVPIPNNSYGQPVCCDIPTAPCPMCSGGRGPRSYTVTIAGGTGDFAWFNGTVTLTSVAPCEWTAGGFYGDTFVINYVAGFLLTASRAMGSVYVAWFNPFGWNCFIPVRPWLLSDHRGTGTIPTAIVSP